MPTIRYMRTEEGAERMYDDGYCWAHAFLWQWQAETMVNAGIKKHPHLKARHFLPTMEDVPKQSQCGYCQRCPHTLEEKVND